MPWGNTDGTHGTWRRVSTRDQQMDDNTPEKEVMVSANVVRWRLIDFLPDKRVSNCVKTLENKSGAWSVVGHVPRLSQPGEDAIGWLRHERSKPSLVGVTLPLFGAMLRVGENMACSGDLRPVIDPLCLPPGPELGHPSRARWMGGRCQLTTG